MKSMEDSLVDKLSRLVRDQTPELATDALPSLVSALIEMTEAYQSTGHYSWGRSIFTRLNIKLAEIQKEEKK